MQEAIKNRRSIRKYKDMPVSRQQPIYNRCGAYSSDHETGSGGIFVVNEIAASFDKILTMDERVSEICNAQSIGAAIENMTLTATELGLGSLWICDTFFAQKELSEWLNGELYAALAVGYAEEKTCARPRKKPENTIEWRL